MVYKLPKEAIADNELEASQLSSNLVNSFVPIGGIIMWSGTVAEAEALTNWRICDGQNGTPDLRDKFVLGVGSSAAASTANQGDTNNNNSITLTEGQMPSHNHNITDNGHSHTINNHTHTFSGSGSNTHNHDFIAVRTGADADESNNGIARKSDEGRDGFYQSENATINFTISGTTGGSGNLSLGVDGVTGDQGGTMGQAFDNLPPYYAIAYIMRYQ